MFLIYGTDSICIKKYKDHSICCKNCKAFDIDIKIYQRYFHILFIPYFPLGRKTATGNCSNCGIPINDTAILQEFEKKTKTPFYIFSGLLLIAVLILLLSFSDLW